MDSANHPKESALDMPAPENSNRNLGEITNIQSTEINHPGEIVPAVLNTENLEPSVELLLTLSNESIDEHINSIESDLSSEKSVYLKGQLKTVVPNIVVLIGEDICLKIILKFGSLFNFSKIHPGDLRLYNILKKTPYIQRASEPNKRKMARYLRNKVILAARVDAYRETNLNDNSFGLKMKEYLQDIFKQLEKGTDLIL